MAGKQSQDSSASYMDGVRVKISEKYKPPPRIGLAMSYAQRLTMNKQLQDTIPSYEFVLEKTVLEKMKEWKTARSVMFEEMNSRVNKDFSEFENQVRERRKLHQNQQSDVTENKEIEISATTSTLSYVDTIPSHVYHQTQPILMPTQATTSTVSNILTPIPLENCSNNYKSAERSPFNISDFEADTSSPFDNMELKSMNDMEELAQVLKGRTEIKPQSSFPPVNNTASFHAGSPSFSTFNIPSTSNYVQPAPTSAAYTYTNGYYYSQDTIQTASSFNSHFQSSYTPQYDKFGYYPVQGVSSKNCPYNKVPDIIKSLETELDNTHLSNKTVKSHMDSNRVEQSAKAKSKSTKNDDFEEFRSLPKNLQIMSQSVSSMGFPLSRVVRVCKILGNDQKKIVEHLLAMSELMDLGFPENTVSKALIQCDNDRDKALDILIS